MAQVSENLEAQSDQQLIAVINNGNVEAFEVLYHRHCEWVVNLAFRFTGDHSAALDVLQDTFLYLLKKFPGFRLTANLKTFLYPAVRNLSINARKKAERYQGTDTDLNAIEHPASSSPAESNDLNSVLSGLSADHRETLVLRFVDGLSLAEIALAMEVPLGTVKSRLHHALQSLRQDPRTKEFFER